ncbi:hypothetical protein [Hungatella sp. SL.1.14]
MTPTLVRPPGGFYNQASLDTLGSMGMAAVILRQRQLPGHG